MKKVVVLACIALVLVGCSTKQPKKETKTCSLEASGMKMAVDFVASDDIVESMKIAITMPEDLIGKEVSKLSEEEMKKMETNALESYGIKEGKGVSVKAKVVDQGLEVSVAFALKDIDSDTMKTLGMDSDSKEAKLSETVAAFEKNGMTCK